jgi:hypothetical protein
MHKPLDAKMAPKLMQDFTGYLRSKETLATSKYNLVYGA